MTGRPLLLRVHVQQSRAGNKDTLASATLDLLPSMLAAAKADAARGGGKWSQANTLTSFMASGPRRKFVLNVRGEGIRGRQYILAYLSCYAV